MDDIQRRRRLRVARLGLSAAAAVVVFFGGLHLFGVVNAISNSPEHSTSVPFSEQYRPGRHVIYLTTDTAALSPADVTITDPAGRPVAVGPPTWSGSFSVNEDDSVSYKGVASFEAPTSGVYTLRITTPSTSTPDSTLSPTAGSIVVGDDIVPAFFVLVVAAGVALVIGFGVRFLRRYRIDVSPPVSTTPDPSLPAGSGNTGPPAPWIGHSTTDPEPF
jgi:hypothetical protein